MGCGTCGREIEKPRGNQIFCRSACRQAAWRIAHPPRKRVARRSRPRPLSTRELGVLAAIRRELIRAAAICAGIP
jgi:hypothetical protein